MSFYTPHSGHLNRIWLRFFLFISMNWEDWFLLFLTSLTPGHHNFPGIFSCSFHNPPVCCFFLTLSFCFQLPPHPSNRGSQTLIALAAALSMSVLDRITYCLSSGHPFIWQFLRLLALVFFSFHFLFLADGNYFQIPILLLGIQDP